MTVATTYVISFGLFRPEGEPVSEDEWNLFLVEEVCPVLESFSITDALGFWRGEPEPCRQLTFITQDHWDATTVHAVASHYKDRFNQDSVLVNSFSSFPDLV
jgi:hypothetical protein